MKRLTVLISAAFVLACSGADDVPVPQHEAPDVPPAGPSVTAPAPTPWTAASIPADPSGKIVLSDATRAAIAKARTDLDAARDAAGVEAAYREAIELGHTLDDELGKSYSGDPSQPLELGWLQPILPGMTPSYEAEGTVLVMQLDPDAWAAKAAATPEPVDDAFFALMKTAYGAASPASFPAWQQPTWDYGGCSALGTGAVLDVLQKADAVRAAGPQFGPEVGAVRQGALDAVLKDDPAFAYCDASTSQPMPDDKLQGEAKDILAKVKLSDDERKAVEARVPELKGQEFHGG